jgi:hypothetical protein
MANAISKFLNDFEKDAILAEVNQLISNKEQDITGTIAAELLNRFAIREGMRPIGAGQVTEIIARVAPSKETLSNMFNEHIITFKDAAVNFLKIKLLI